MSGYIYLASPYSAPTARSRTLRFLEAFSASAWLIKHGYASYSPIVSWHHLAAAYELPTNHEFWLKQNTAMLDGAGHFAILNIPGWKESAGVMEEFLHWEARRTDSALLPPPELLTYTGQGYKFSEISW